MRPAIITRPGTNERMEFHKFACGHPDNAIRMTDISQDAPVTSAMAYQMYGAQCLSIKRPTAPIKQIDAGNSHNHELNNNANQTK